jgi:membrane-anchored protein YejM (alkaline phosphatase superfamily)
LARAARGARHVPAAVGFGLIALSGLLATPAVVVPVPDPYPPRLRDELYMSPFVYVLGDVRETLHRKPSKYTRLSDAKPERKHVGPRFDPPMPAAAPRARARYNVLLVVMESTGYGYVFDRRRGPMPMPRLHALAREGLELRRHYATANTSPRAIFSIFTGLYPQPTTQMFETRPDVRFPGIGTFLGPDYERFLVTPGRLKSFFPRGMLNHDGVHELYGYDELPIEHPIAFPAGGRSEIQTADFFLKRLSRAKEPFFATYYSYAPHFGYYDQGEEFRIRPKLDDDRHRYYNSLRLLDTQIGRFVDQLRDRGQLERTVIVLVGDHGEAFGQHPDNYTHARASYDENLRVPAVFHHPKLFEPKVVKQTTSHVDVLPTLLDALGIPFDAQRIQGSSVLRGELQRPYVYAWGSEGTLTSVDRDAKRKLQIKFSRDKCTYYDLALDPNERAPQKCTTAPTEQLDALLDFYKWQRTVLPRENPTAR